MENKNATKRSLKDELILAGVRFLNEQPLEALTIRKLASMCHVTPHAIYNHFENKAALVDAINDYVMKGLIKYSVQVVTQPSLGFPEKLYKLATAYLTIDEKYPYHLLSLNNMKGDAFYHIVSDENGFVCKSKFPGWPNIRSLFLAQAPLFGTPLAEDTDPDQVAAYLDATASNSTASIDDETDACLDQITLYAMINGLPHALHDGIIPPNINREAFIRSSILYLVKRML